MNRRQFVEFSMRSAGLAVLGGAFTVSSPAADPSKANPFAYDVDALAKTDPKLIQYVPAGRFTCTSPEPRRLALGPDNRVYIAARNGISVLDPAGAALRELPLPVAARCVAVAPEGTVYAGLRDRVEVIDPAGRSLATWQVAGKKTWLTGLAVGGNDVWVADSGSRVVLRYDRSGKLVGKLGEKNKEHNVPGLIVPSPYLDVAVARDGLVRINNPGRHCIEVYTANGELEFSWGRPSAAIDGFCGCCNPVALSFLPDGRCLTCEKGLPRVKVYSAEGKFDCVVAGPESFPESARAGSVRDLSDGTMGGLDAAADAQGQVYILDIATGYVRIMKPKG